jgi:transposase
MTFETQNLDNLGLVAGMCQELDIAGIVDREVGPQAQNKALSFGEALVCMLLNGLGFVGRTLYLYSEYFEDKPLGHLLGKQFIKPQHVDDNLLGRTLDKLFELDVTKLFTKIALHAVKTLGIKVKSLHLDGTSFHVDGEYKSSLEQGEEKIKLVPGYSRDHRPDLNQAILHLITSNQGNLPLYMQAADGNTSDKTAFAEIIDKHIDSFKQAVTHKYFVGDSALYTPNSLQRLYTSGSYFVTRVPMQIKAAQHLVETTLKEALVPICENYWATEQVTEYANIKQRWILIFSEAAYKRECLTLKKRWLKESEKECKQLSHLKNREFSCKKDAEKAIQQFESKLKYTELIDIEILEHKKYPKAGRPRQEVQGTSCFTIKGAIGSSLKKKERAERNKGYFVLATNDLNKEKFTPQEVLTTYKEQQSVERGFRFLKSPDFLVSSFYLKKPERIEALLMVMTLCLLVYAAIEHKVRERLKECKLHFLDQKKRPSQKPTTRWIFFCFLGIHVLIIDGKKNQVTNLKERHRIILHCLGPPYQYFYYAEQWREN